MGPGRSLRVLVSQYNECEQNTTPTRCFRTLATWSTRYAWQERAEECDAELEKRKTARAEEIMQSGLALAHNRVEKLKVLALFLHTQMYERGEDGVYHNIWLPDVKQIAGTRVDIERFNAAIISEYRATLDDIAKETGGRKSKLELSGEVGHGSNLTEEQRNATLDDLARRYSEFGVSSEDGPDPMVAEPGEAD